MYGTSFEWRAATTNPPHGRHADIIPRVWIICPQCRNRLQDQPGDIKQYSCPFCGNRTLVRVRTEQERSRDALAGMAAGAAVGAAVGELPGALIGGLVGLVLGLLRTPTIEQVRQ
jgi:DNA-directed RNA polymerase subunit RPC12/RpoP